jgi:hypothetical protein
VMVLFRIFKRAIAGDIDGQVTSTFQQSETPQAHFGSTELNWTLPRSRAAWIGVTQKNAVRKMAM